MIEEPRIKRVFTATKNVLKTPRKRVLYGGVKTGKTTLAGYLERPFFLATEKGCEGIKGAKKFSYVDENGIEQVDIPQDWATLVDMMEQLKDKDYIKAEGYKNIILDSGKFVDKLITDDIIRKTPEVLRDGKMVKVTSVAMYGFQTGSKEVLTYWEKILAWADKLNSRGIDFTVIAHAAKVKHIDPNGTELKRWEPDLEVAIGGTCSVSDLLCARVDEVLYMESETQTEKKKGYMNKDINVPINGALEQFNRPEIKLYTRQSNYFLAGVRADVSNVLPVYDIDVFNPETCKKVWADLKK